jgi:hypothetical protein
MEARLRFTCQHLPEADDVSEDFIERAFDQKALGGFAQLSVSDEVFLQTVCRGRPSNCAPPNDPFVEKLRTSIERTGSEPWTLEFVDGVGRKEFKVQGDLTLERVKTAFVEYLRSDGQWRQNHAWEEVDTRNNPFPNPMPDEAFKLMETIPNDALRLDELPGPDAGGTDVWRLADTFNGFKHWGSLERCAEIADRRFYDQQRDSNLTELRTCLFYECRRWHYFGELPDWHCEPYVRGLVEKIRERVATGQLE